MSRVHLIDHPLAAHHLAQLRDAGTPPEAFRVAVQRLSHLLLCEATRDLETEPVVVRTPLAEASGARLAGRIALVPILRAGLGMIDPVLMMVPGAEVWHLGVYRNERTLQPVEYYHKLPPGNPPGVGVIVDPMLATGGSAVWAVEALKRWNVARIKLLSIIAAPEGIDRVRASHGDVQVYVCAIDSHLDDRGYIVPGLGDAGDRIFGTTGDA